MSRLDKRKARPIDLAASADRVQAGHALALGLRAAYLVMHRRANQLFTRYGLTADQFVLLNRLSECDGITQKELARLTHSDSNTISEMLGRLERRRLIKRERHPDDGRALLVSLTDAGCAVQRRAMAGLAPFCAALADLVPPAEMEPLLCHLSQIADGLSPADGPLACGADAQMRDEAARRCSRWMSDSFPDEL